MLKALGLKSAPKAPEADHGLTAVQVLKDATDLENGLRAMDLVMDDRPSASQKILANSSSTYYKLAQGVVHFLEATLGFEPEAIRQAIDSLHDADQASARDRAHAQRYDIHTSSYPPGSEYLLTQAEAHLMSAIALFLSESMIDAAKAFLRLRKAYQVLDDLNRQIQAHKGQRRASLTTKSSRNTTVLPPPPSAEQLKQIQKAAAEYQAARTRRLSQLTPTNASSDTLVTLPTQPALSTLADPASAGVTSVDEFIESGVNSMFGLLQLLLSIIPPTLGKVMSMVGFRGDREIGLNMLWKAADVDNIHGSIALLALLQYYDGPTKFTDIQLDQVPSSGASSSASDTAAESDPGAPPKGHLAEAELARIKKRLESDLDRIRTRYTRGALWQLQHGRMVAQTDLVEGVRILDDTSRGPIEMKQVEGLMLFDKTIMTVILHRFEQSAVNFIRLIDLNTWSHAFYMYMAGACYVELYRQNLEKDPAKAKAAKAKALEYMEKAPTMMGKRKFMAKAMPFDVFVARKVNLWKSRLAQAPKGYDLIDVIGTSPVLEVLYIWNGFSRMPRDGPYLEDSLKALSYKPKSTGTTAPPFVETASESVSRLLIQSVVLRAMGRIQEGFKLLETEVLPLVCTPLAARGLSVTGVPAKLQYHRHLSEPWSGPSALYERAIFEWQLHGKSHAAATREYLDLAAAWDEDYELSTRISMLIKSAQDRLDSYNL